MQSSNLAHFDPWIFVIKNVDLVHSIRKGSWMPWSVQLVSIPELEISSIQKLSFLKIGLHSQQFFSTLSVWDLWIHRHTHLPTHMHTSTPTHPHTCTHAHTHTHTNTQREEEWHAPEHAVYIVTPSRGVLQTKTEQGGSSWLSFWGSSWPSANTSTD